MFCSYRDSANTVTMGTYSQSRQTRERSTFITDVLWNLRQNHEEYVFSQEQLDEVKKRLKKHETLNMAESDGIYTISLTKGE
jgi:hypothetical protein